MSKRLGKADRPEDHQGLGQRPAALCLVWDSHGRLLTVSRPEVPYEMAIPGGLVEIGENADVAAARELAEECGVEVHGLRYVQTLTSPTDGRPVLVFAAAAWHGSPAALDDATKIAWLHPEELFDQAALFRSSIIELVQADLLAPEGALRKAEEEEEEEEEERRVLGDVDWTPVVDAVRAQITPVAEDGARQTLAVLGIADDDSITDQVFETAVDWAKARAAELVGKTYDDDGNLVDNPDADLAITDTIREEIRTAVAQSIAEGESAADLSDRIQDIAGFSADRADLIARSEIVNTHAKAQLIALKGSGVVEKKGWSTAEDGDTCDDCKDNEDAGAIDLDDDFPSGDDSPIAHPACRCVLTAIIDDQGADDEDQDDADDESDDEENS